jgi:putative ABC transport system permease protein
MAGVWSVVRAVLSQHRGRSLTIALTVGTGVAASAVAAAGSTASGLLAGRADDSTLALLLPILRAFGLITLTSAALLIVSVSSGVIAGQRRQMAILLVLGFTPREVAAVVVAQVVIPALVGGLIGFPVGVVATGPVLAQAAAVFGPGALVPSAGQALAVLLGAAAVVMTAALAPARGITRVALIAAASHGSGGGVSRRVNPLVGALPLGVVGRLTLARLSARTLRSLMVGGAVAFGVAAVVFTVTLQASIRLGAEAILRAHASPLRTASMSAAVAPGFASTLAGDPDVSRFVEVGTTAVQIAGVSGSVAYVGYSGDSSWLGYEIVEGHWYGKPGEVVVSTRLLDRLGITVGQAVTISSNGRPVTVSVVGTTFEIDSGVPDHLVMRGALTTIPGVEPKALDFEIEPAAGVDKDELAARLRDRGLPASVVPTLESDPTVLILQAAVLGLGALLIAVSLVGVAAAVGLDAAERGRENAILGALGMTPRALAGLALAGPLVIAVLAGLLGVPLGMGFASAVLVEMGRAAAETRVPTTILEPLGSAAPLLALIGLPIAACGGLLGWRLATRRPIAGELQAE